MEENTAARMAREPRMALVLEGGGMRAAYSIGALCALEDRGLTSSFDIVVGSSAGAVNGAYFVAGQAGVARQIYAGPLASSAFVGLRRRPVDIDFLVDVVLRRDLPLDVGRIRRSGTLVEAVLTNVDTGRPDYLSLADASDPYEVLRATTAIPVLYNRTVEIGGCRYVDGGVAEPMPCERAVWLGATGLLSVFTRSYRRRARSSLARVALKSMLRGQPSEIRKGVLEDPERYERSVRLMQDDGSRLRSRWALWPSRPAELVGMCTRRADHLVRCSDMGYQDMQDLLSSPAG